MKLVPGIYKIKNSSYMGGHHLLQVYKKADEHYFRIDHGQENDFESSDKLDGYQVLKQLASLEVKNAKISITFEDGEGSSYEMNARTVLVVRDIFRIYPQLAEALGSGLVKKVKK